ncbi:MAG TPA: rRNA maturation RNase YbeY [Rhizomicrobium sp.]|jgi:probable rRNA maturation factor
MTKIAIVVEDAGWKKRGLSARLQQAAELGLKAARRKGGVTVLLTSSRKLRALNFQFRGKDKPTNVLSFPADEPGYLGDIAIAYGVAAREARAEKKSLSDHAAHLALHGTLHLLGYDHETGREAEVMEALETKLLARLGIADPYAKRGAHG